MLSVFDGLRDVTTLSVFVRLACALICGGIIGIERSYKRRPAGFRTHILICIGAAITTLTSQYLYLNMHYFTDMARLGAQVVAGIGFIGAGTIIVTKRQRVKGLTTAAGLWASACLGLAIGAGYYECVAVSVALILVCMYAFPALENRLIQRSRYMNILAELDGMECLGGVLAALREQGVTVFDIDLSKQPEDRRAQLGVHLSVYLPKGLNHTELLAQLAALGGTVSIEESQ